jgi:hypothetical protein
VTCHISVDFVKISLLQKGVKIGGQKGYFKT